MPEVKEQSYLDRIMQTEPIGYEVSAEWCEQNITLVEGEGKFAGVVFNTPSAVRLDFDNESYLKSHIFTVRAIEARKVKTLIQLLEQGEGSADLAHVSRLLMRVAQHQNEGQKDPAMPVKGEKIHFVTAYATKDGEHVLDENGERVLNVKAFTIPPAVEKRLKLSFGKKSISE